MSNTKDRYEGIDRAPRENKTREKTAQRRPWAPPSMLDAPPAPEGFKHRWIRAEVRGHDDRKTSQLDYEKDGNLSVVTNTLTLRHQWWIQVNMKECLGLVD